MPDRLARFGRAFFLAGSAEKIERVGGFAGTPIVFRRRGLFDARALAFAWREKEIGFKAVLAGVEIVVTATQSIKRFVSAAFDDAALTNRFMLWVAVTTISTPASTALKPISFSRQAKARALASKSPLRRKTMGVPAKPPTRSIFSAEPAKKNALPNRASLSGIARKKGSRIFCSLSLFFLPEIKA